VKVGRSEIWTIVRSRIKRLILTGLIGAMDGVCIHVTDLGWQNAVRNHTDPSPDVSTNFRLIVEQVDRVSSHVAVSMKFQYQILAFGAEFNFQISIILAQKEHFNHFKVIKFVERAGVMRHVGQVRVIVEGRRHFDGQILRVEQFNVDIVLLVNGPIVPGFGDGKAG